jgi:hypothetical protein
MEHCQSLKVLSFERLKMDEHHCRVLGCCSTPGLEIVLMDCVIVGSGASNVAQVLGHNRGPTKHNICNTANLDLADGLGGNGSLKNLRPRLSDDSEVSNREVLAIAGALRGNHGLVDLGLSHDFRMSDEM